MPHLETREEYKLLPWFAHMGPADAAIWSRFIAKNPDRFTGVFYDFRVGVEPEMPEGIDSCVHVAWCDLTHWRIDVVGEDGEKIYIIEVKPYANAKALGQACAYACRFAAEQNPKVPVVPVVLTDRILETTKLCAEAMGVQMWEA